MSLTKVKGSILSDELYRRENNLNDVLDKKVARNNLSLYSKEETFSKTDFVNFVFMFAGFEADIPDGFQLCNGEGQTSNGINIPDLRDRFIIGSGSSYSVGSKGGSTSATTNTTGNHSHSVNVGYTTLSVSQMPSHNHVTYRKNWANTSYGGGFNGWEWRYQTKEDRDMVGYEGNSASHGHSGSCSSTGSHSHSVNITPPYYALAFIIKL